MAKLFLGIESSCDDTAAAVVSSDRRILSSVVMDQNTLHAAFGGVVPEIAARAHAEKLDIAVEAALEQSGVALTDIDAVSVRRAGLDRWGPIRGHVRTWYRSRRQQTLDRS